MTTPRLAGIALHSIAANGLHFRVATAGPERGPLVMLLHGFPEFWYGWRHQMTALARAGLRVVAPDQRGYGLSDKPAGIAAYALDSLADDVLAVADEFERSEFALVGHDWGGIVAWHLCGRDPHRITRAVILNAPHPASFAAFAMRHPVQLRKSLYAGFFQMPWLPEMALSANGYAALRRALSGSSRQGTFEDAELDQYLQAWSEPGALSAMLNWYRAALLARPRTGRIDVPLRVIWGDADDALESGLAEAAVAYCHRGEVIHLPDATHWLHHEAPARINRLIIEFLKRAKQPGGRRRKL